MSEYAIGTERLCPRCGTKKPLQNFFQNYADKEFYLPLCRKCSNVIYQKARDKFKSEAAGICIAASTQNVPVIKHALDVTLEKMKAKSDKASGFLAYYDTLKEFGEVYEGLIDSDVSLGDFVQLRDRQEIQAEEENKIDYDELAKVWGHFTDREGEPDKDAYEFLEDLYTKYTENLLQMDTAMEQTYRDLCIAHWQKRKADEGGDMGEVEKARKQINQNLALLKLDKFSANALSDEEKHIEYLIWEIENTTPAECEDLEKYKDFSGFEKAFGTIMRCVKNLVTGSKEYPELTKEQSG